MKKILFIAFFAILSLYTYSQTYYTFSNTTNYSIPDNDEWVNDGFVHGVESDITVSGIPPTAEIDHIEFNITHTYDGDLDIYLVYYDNRVDISSGNGGSGNDYTSTIIKNNVATSITSGSAPFTGTFRPESPLPVFGEPDRTFNPNGKWTLNVCDHANNDTGTLLDFKIVFKSPECPSVNYTDQVGYAMNCDSGNDTLIVDDYATAGGSAYPTLYLEFTTDGNGDQTNNNIAWRVNGTVYGTDVVDNNSRFTWYFGKLSPTYDFSVDVSNQDGTTNWMIYDGNGTIHASGTVTNSSETNLGQGSYPQGSGTWSSTGGGVYYWDSGEAYFVPGEAGGAGTYDITYTWDNGGSGDYHCTGTSTHTFTINNPYSAAWTAPTTSYCVDASSVNLTPNITGTTGGTWTGAGMSSAGVFSPGTAGAGTHSITYTYDAGGGCEKAESHNITVNPLPTITLGSNSAICDGDDLNLTYTGNGTSWSWAGPNGYSSTDEDPTITGASTLYAGTYNVTVTDGNGCTNTGNTSVTINSLPTVNITSSDADNTLCAGESITLTGGGSWDNGVNEGQAFTPTSTNTYTVTVTDANSCSNTGQITITVNALPVANAGDDQNINYGNSTTMINTAPSGAYTYNWTPGTMLNDSTTLAPTTVNLTTSQTYTLVVTDNNTGCVSNSDDVTITVIGGPLSIQISDNDTICLGDTTIVSGIVSGGTGTNTYSWTPTTGLSDASVYNPNAYPTVTTTYILTVNDGATTVTDSVQVVVVPLPVISSVDVTNLNCYNDNSGSIQINATGSNPLDYSINDAVSFSQNNGNFTNMAVGTGFITVVKDVYGCVAYGDTVDITQPQPLQVNVSSIVDASCGQANGSATLTTQGGISPYNYSGQTPSTDSVYVNLSSGTYTITVTDANNCNDTVSYTIGNLGGGSVSVTNTTDALCFGDATGTVTATMTNGTPNYIYYLTQGSDTLATVNSGSGSITFDTLVAGAYTITAKEGAGCLTSDNFTIGEPNKIILTDSVVHINCFGNDNGQIFVNANGGTGVYSYNWNSGQNTSHITNLSQGSYSVVVTDLNSCSDSITNINIFEPTQLMAYITVVNSLKCYNDSTGELSVTAENGTSPYTYLWSNNESSTTISNLHAGNYSVTIADVNGCTARIDTSLAQPESMLISDSIYYGKHYGNIKVKPIGGTPDYEYNWSNGSADSLITNLISGNYYITITDANNCSVTNSYKIENMLIVPSVITPNGDGKNDKFRITDIETIKNVKINIFNRWGDLIYNYDGSGVGYPAKEWNGTDLNGHNLPIGSYVYVIEMDGTSESYKGTITIVR